MKKSKVNRQWLHTHLNDGWVKQAQKDGYRSRAAYKLKEIDEKFALFKPGAVVVDLGAAPGAWSQYISRKVLGAADTAKAGAVFALDLLPLERLDGVCFLQGDFREEPVLRQLEELLAQYFSKQGNVAAKVDVVVSDMAPNLSGIKVADAVKIQHLLELALDFAAQHLKPQGTLVAKAFYGSGYSQILTAFKKQFKQVKVIKPQASRDKSAEIFLVGCGLK